MTCGGRVPRCRRRRAKCAEELDGHPHHPHPVRIVVSCQNERSQLQNKQMAMRVLRARLYAVEEAKLEEQRIRLRGDHVSAEWGSQIRSYVLHPYRMVKDLRTEYETGNTDAVLDGDLDAFMRSYLESTVGRKRRRTLNNKRRWISTRRFALPTRLP